MNPFFPDFQSNKKIQSVINLAYNEPECYVKFSGGIVQMLPNYLSSRVLLHSGIKMDVFSQNKHTIKYI